MSAAHVLVCAQALLNKVPQQRLSCEQLLKHPFVRETDDERAVREARRAADDRLAAHSRAWKGEGGVQAQNFLCYVIMTTASSKAPTGERTAMLSVHSWGLAHERAMREARRTGADRMSATAAPGRPRAVRVSAIP